MANLKLPKFNLAGNTAENFKTFDLRFDFYCIQVRYRDSSKNRPSLHGFVGILCDYIFLHVLNPCFLYIQLKNTSFISNKGLAYSE